MTSVYSTCLDTSDSQDEPVMAAVRGHQGIACHFRKHAYSLSCSELDQKIDIPFSCFCMELESSC